VKNEDRSLGEEGLKRSVALPIPGLRSSIPAAMRSRCAAVLAVVSIPGIGLANAKPGIDGPAGRVGYSLGHQIGEDLKRQRLDIDADAMLRGLRDALGATNPSIPEEEMNGLLVGLKKSIGASEMKGGRADAERYRAEGSEFLAANATRDGVVSLPSGLQYEVLRAGTGNRPGSNDSVKVHYRSTLIDGTAFHDSSRPKGEPETLHVSGVTRGLTEALQLMREGARWRLFLPADLAFGRRGPLADRTVIYEIELVSIEAGE
jgi:FKBP-type peptidyl-prolyl cis-trans isomerase FklB